MYFNQKSILAADYLRLSREKMETSWKVIVSAIKEVSLTIL